MQHPKFKTQFIQRLANLRCSMQEREIEALKSDAGFMNDSLARMKDRSAESATGLKRRVDGLEADREKDREAHLVGCRNRRCSPGPHPETRDPQPAPSSVRHWPSIYASAWVVSTYKKRGGTYKGKKPKESGINKWFDEEWVHGWGSVTARRRLNV